MRVTKNKKATIFTILGGVLSCSTLLIWCGCLINSQGKFVYQTTQLGINFFLLIIIAWTLGFLIYKIFQHEQALTEIKELNVEIKNLVSKNQELMNYIIANNELDFTDLQNFNYNNRELLLKLYFKSTGGVCSDKERIMDCKK